MRGSLLLSFFLSEYLYAATLIVLYLFPLLSIFLRLFGSGLGWGGRGYVLKKEMICFPPRPLDRSRLGFTKGFDGEGDGCFLRLNSKERYLQKRQFSLQLSIVSLYSYR